VFLDGKKPKAVRILRFGGDAEASELSAAKIAKDSRRPTAWKIISALSGK
jgi:hypothetical protein